MVTGLSKTVKHHEFGLGIVLDATDVNRQNRGCPFSLDPKHINVLAPSKKPFHTLNPAMALLEDGRTLGRASETLKLEAHIAPEVVADLKRCGHDVDLLQAFDETMGHAGAIVRHTNGVFDAEEVSVDQGLRASDQGPRRSVQP